MGPALQLLRAGTKTGCLDLLSVIEFTFVAAYESRQTSLRAQHVSKLSLPTRSRRGVFGRNLGTF